MGEVVEFRRKPGIQIDDHDANGRLLEKRPVTQFSLPEFIFSFLAFRYVAERRKYSGGAIIFNCSRVQLSRNYPTVLSNIRRLRDQAPCACDLGNPLGDRRRELRRVEVRRRHLKQLLAAVT